MKPKHKPCINCGANKYEPIEDGFKCEFCGTLYEIEMPKVIIREIDRQVFPKMSTCATSYFTGTAVTNVKFGR